MKLQPCVPAGGVGVGGADAFPSLPPTARAPQGREQFSPLLVPVGLLAVAAQQRRSKRLPVSRRGNARWMQGRARSQRLARAASVMERPTLEAGARLLEEAVRISQDESNPTQFQCAAETTQSYVSQQSVLLDGNEDAVDEDGLPLSYSVERIASFWDTRPSELSDRWNRFLAISTPFVTRFAFAAINNKLWDEEEELARLAVNNMTELGPTFVKLGQVLSIRPDVLPPKTMKELARLQDNIEVFPTEEARSAIEKELGKPIDELFSSFSESPIAAASLAQVYRATLRETGEEVAVKVQRPGALSTVSKDLYVLRRLADVFQPLIRRFTADETDYIALTETFAEGLYTELDFRNEALNAIRMQEMLNERAEPALMERLVIPAPLPELSTRRVMLSKWVNGVKLSSLPPQELRDLIGVGQELFLTQLLELGFFHGDPHPGNLLKITEGPDEGKLCLLDFGLVAQVPKTDRDVIVGSVIHLGTQNWEGLIDDFIVLGFLTKDVDRGLLIPILQRILGPYLKGGGASSLKNANFQALSQDLLKVNLEVRFKIPPYVSLLARSIATLEGVALQGDPGYQIISQAYPFVVRRLLQNDNRQSFGSLRELLYDRQTGRLRPQRLSAMLQASLGVVVDASSMAGFIDFDAVPDDGAPLSDVLTFLLSKKAANLRPLLNAELAYGLDLGLRRAGQRLKSVTRELLQPPRIPILGIRLPAPPTPPLLLPVSVPVSGGERVVLLRAEEVLDAALPPLSNSEDVDFRTFAEALEVVLLGGGDTPRGDLLEPSPEVLLRVLRGLASSDGSGAELAAALRQSIATSESRAVITDEVIASVAQEILTTWQERLRLAFKGRGD
eukprot:CAMPEP_0170579030 /NCGR_PEP_ID=MMETSP0224-20130122/5770_1 /TAXON_ID=285029 /ORGANISM="Togula jolla, Strain CCCM 725" /LENGTH=846 /DNA_ID=CAMNT_0010902035 /DNA_START=10 /DNA_END=2550 /DNA_ORIENTATION=-